MACPNDCSGHGVCKFVEHVPFGTVFGDYQTTDKTYVNPSTESDANWIEQYNHDNYIMDSIPDNFPGSLATEAVRVAQKPAWDSRKVRKCVCDAGYTDVDCSRRMCNHGNDVLDERIDVTKRAISTHSRSCWQPGADMATV